jgi:DNA-binding CsgD family transcriptional regulator
MENDSKRKKIELAEKQERLWDAVNAVSGGVFQQRVHVLLEEQPMLTPLDARMKTLADEGWRNVKIMKNLGIAEQTFYNHTSKMRKIAGAKPRTNFRSLFAKPKRDENPKPPDTKENL